MIPGISMQSLVRANRRPSDSISKRSMGILVVDQAPIKIMIFTNETPFRLRTAATGKAPYSGPAVAEPSIRAKRCPFNPVCGPMNFIITGLGIQTSSKPSKTNTGGIIRSISMVVAVLI